MTLRELIKEKSALLRHPDKLGFMKVAEELVELSSLLSSLNAEIAEKQFELNKVKLAFLGEFKSAAQAKIAAEATQQWDEWNKRVQLRHAMEELIRALKYYLKAASTEYSEFTR